MTLRAMLLVIGSLLVIVGAELLLSRAVRALPLIRASPFSSGTWNFKIMMITSEAGLVMICVGVALLVSGAIIPDG